MKMRKMLPEKTRKLQIFTDYFGKAALINRRNHCPHSETKDTLSAQTSAAARPLSIVPCNYLANRGSLPHKIFFLLTCALYLAHTHIYFLHIFIYFFPFAACHK